jgi:hypothetical protein
MKWIAAAILVAALLISGTLIYLNRADEDAALQGRCETLWSEVQSGQPDWDVSFKEFERIGCKERTGPWSD